MNYPSILDVNKLLCFLSDPTWLYNIYYSYIQPGFLENALI